MSCMARLTFVLFVLPRRTMPGPPCETFLGEHLEGVRVQRVHYFAYRHGYLDTLQIGRTSSTGWSSRPQAAAFSGALIALRRPG